jgi:N-acetyl-anhydromuramyl-L-alanine amidase AmpD
MDDEHIYNEAGETYRAGGGIAPCYNYAADAYVQTPTCNYSSRSGTPVSAVTIHTIQGTYAGAISWAQNCSANVSYHYVVSNTGQITQMLCEADKGWHVGTENPYTIGIEHDGTVSNPNNYTPAMYGATADLVYDITESGYGINSLRTAYFPWAATTNYNATNTPGSCVRIKGHQHFPNQTHTDPGQYWDWDYFYKLINPNTAVTTLTDASGTFYDDGGQIGVYSSDLRSLTLIQSVGADSVTVTFQSFDLEDEWDYLYIYDGTDVFAPLIGVYTGTDNPGTITSQDGYLLFEFRSDCAIAETGWEATYQGHFDPVGFGSVSENRLKIYPNPTWGIVNLPQVDDLKWELTDATGRLVAEGIKERQIDLQRFGLSEQVLILNLLSNDLHRSLRLLYLKQ